MGPACASLQALDKIKAEGYERRAPADSQCSEDTLQDVAEGEIESNWDQVVDNFDNMNLKPELLRGIYAYGCVCCYFRCAPITNSCKKF